MDRRGARGRGQFFLRIQNTDGSWYRAVDTDGNPVRVPEHWFGRTETMRKSGRTASLCSLYDFLR